MKQGRCLGMLALLAAALWASPEARAQNLGLGTGSRSAGDSAAADRGDRGEDNPRRTQMNKRLGLTARRPQAFDPKIYEARGRDLQNQFYVIGTPADPKRGELEPVPGGMASDVALQRQGRKQWMIWVGVAGFAGASAGAVGYLLMSKAHPNAPPPKDLVLTDEP